MGEFIAIAKVNFYDDIDNSTLQENIIMTHIHSFSEAVCFLEKYYGTNLESFSLELLEGPFLRVSDASVEKLVHEEL